MADRITPHVHIRVRKVATHGIPDWVDYVLAAWFLLLASFPFVILGWALWDTFA